MAARSGRLMAKRPANVTASAICLIVTVFKTSNHVFHDAGDAVTEAAHTLEDNLELGRVLPFQVGIVKIRHLPGDIFVVTQM